MTKTAMSTLSRLLRHQYQEDLLVPKSGLARRIALCKLRRSSPRMMVRHCLARKPVRLACLCLIQLHARPRRDRAQHLLKRDHRRPSSMSRLPNHSSPKSILIFSLRILIQQVKRSTLLKATLIRLWSILRLRITTILHWSK